MCDTEASYRRHWAILTGKSEREIYVPLALREPSLSAVLVSEGLIEDFDNEVSYK